MKKLLLFLALLWPVTLAAQPAPTVVTSLRTTDTSATSLRVGCALSGSCTGGIAAGPIDVSSITSGGFIGIANNVPASQTMRLVNNAGTLQWNGVALATGASLSGTLNTIPLFTGASSVGNSIMTQNVGATIITVGGALNATTLAGTLSTATQNSVTTMTGLTSIGTIATGTWNATIIGLAKGGTGVSLAGTGGTGQFLKQNTLGGTITVTRPAIADLSDASNVALLNAANTFTAFGAHLFASSGAGSQHVDITNATSGATARSYLNVGAGTTNAYLIANSQGFTPSGSSLASGVDLQSGGAGGLSLSATDVSGAIRFYTGGGLTPRWGINAAGDHTFGASSHIADSSGTPTIASGFGTSPSIVGTDYAFKVTTGTPGAVTGVVNFGHTWTTAPICIAASEFPASAATANTITTAQVTLAISSTAALPINVSCRGY